MKIETYREIEDSLQKAKELIEKCLEKKSEIKSELNTDEKYQKTWFENLDKIYQEIIANQIEMIFTLKIDD